MNTKKLIFLTLATISLLASVAPSSQAAPQFHLRPYGLLGQMEGDLTTENISSDFKLGWGNGIQKGNGLLGVEYEVNGDEISSLTQLAYTSLSDTTPEVPGQSFVDAQQDFDAYFVSQLIGLNVYKDGVSFLDINIGGRFVSARNSLKLRGDTGERAFEEEKIWIDPIVGVSSSFLLDDGLDIRVGGDFGGFGVASDSTWQAWSALGFTLTKRATLEVGYRALSYTYEDGSFKYDMLIHGPTVGMEFSF